MNKLLIDTTQIRQMVAPNALGLNTNFLADHADMRAHGQGYTAALREMGVRSLRYPGGDKSNEYFWSQPPWTAPRPTLAITGPEGRLFNSSQLVTAEGQFLVKPLDFDEFIDICREVGAEPIICINIQRICSYSFPFSLALKDDNSLSILEL